MWSLPEINAVFISLQIILSSLPALSCQSARTTHWHHSRHQEWVSTRAGLLVCLFKGHSYKELEEFGNQPGTVGGEREGWGGGWEGELSGKLTAKNNRDSRVPEAALTSAAPVKGQELRGSDRENRQLHPIITSSPLLAWLWSSNRGYRRVIVLMSPLTAFFWRCSSAKDITVITHTAGCSLWLHWIKLTGFSYYDHSSCSYWLLEDAFKCIYYGNQGGEIHSQSFEIG